MTLALAATSTLADASLTLTARPPAARRGKALAVLAVLLAAACWGALGTSYALIQDWRPVPPMTIVAVRALSAGALLLLFVMRDPPRRQVLRALFTADTAAFTLFAGLISTAAFYVTLIYAFQRAGVAVATVLLYLAPALVALAARVVFGERVGRAQWLALALALAGVAGVSGALSGARPVSASGAALGLLSAVGYASYSIVGRRLLRVADPTTVVAAVLSVGGLALLALKTLVDGRGWPDWPTVAVLIVVNGVGTTLLPMLLYTWGLARLGPGRASLLATAEPAIAVILAYVVLGETLQPLQVAGAASICAGLFVVGISTARR